MVLTWLVTISLVVTVISAIYQFIRYKQSYFERLGVPHIKPTFFLGSAGGLVRKQRSVFGQVQWLYEQIPSSAKYCGFYNFTEPVVMLKDLDLIKEVTGKQFDSFADRSPFTIEEMDPLFSKNVSVLRGKKWREVRAMLTPFFTGLKLKGMFNLINKCATDFKEYLREENEESVAVDTKDLFTRYTNDVIAMAAFGLQINSLKDRDNEFFKLAKISTTLNTSNLKIMITRLFPWIARVLGIRILPKAVSNYYVNLIDFNIKTRRAEGISRPDVIQMMMQASETLDIVEMTAQAFVFLFGGLEPVATALCFVAHQIAAHPEVQEKLYQEIKEKYSQINNEVTGYDVLKDLHYLDAVINETLRMYPVTQLIDRVCTKDFELPSAVPGGKPFIVKKGSVLWVPIAGLHYDSNHHNEPEKFKPERFLNCDGTLKMKITDSPTFMPFGIGPRICIAHRLAMLEIKLIITHLLASYQLLLSKKTPNPIQLSKKVILMTPENGFWLHLKSRN